MHIRGDWIIHDVTGEWITLVPPPCSPFCESQHGGEENHDKKYYSQQN